MMETNELVARYAALWNEPDEGLRRAGVAALWARDGAHFTTTLEARGHDAINERIQRAFERFVGPGDFVFRALEGIDAHHGSVKFYWAMVPKDGGMARSVGSDFLVLDETGRIRADYQFIEP